jgi:glycosyltransferase involved in cell wall biosynthesis
MRTARAGAPRVSVVVAAYNAAAFIEKTLRTALDQSFTNLEVVVIDDGSKDETGEVVRRLASHDPRLRLVVQANRGLAGARNRGVLESQGELIAFLDHDDLWHREKIAAQVEALDAHGDAAVASCHSALIDENHACLGWRYGGNANGDVYAEMLEWDMISGGSVALMRRAALEGVGPFDETLPMRSDWDMWIRLARRHSFVTVPRVLVGYTRSPFSSSRGYERMEAAGRCVLEKVRREDATFDDARFRFCSARDLFAVSCACTIDGEVSLAWRYLQRSLRLTPTPVLSTPRRWALVGVLALQTVLPDPAYRFALGALNRVSFQLPPGLPFSKLDASTNAS